MEIFETLELDSAKLSESIENLSRGMQQKVAIARALFTTPSLLLLDEPTTGLDPKSKKQVQSYVSKINKENGITTILTTHDMSEAEALCDQLAIMKDGKIITQGTTDELKQKSEDKNGDEASSSLEEIFIKIAEEK
jgi:ABC-2 type transport system ATP-binding protein